MARRKAYATLQCVWKNVKKDKVNFFSRIALSVICVPTQPLDYLEIQKELMAASSSSKTISAQLNQTDDDDTQIDDSFDGESSASTEDSVPFQLIAETNVERPANVVGENSSAQLCSTEAVFGDSESSANGNSFPPQGEFSGSSLEDEKCTFRPSPSLIVLPSKACIVDDEVEKDSVIRNRLSREATDEVSEEEQTDNNGDQEFDKGLGWKNLYRQCELYSTMGGQAGTSADT